MFVASYLGPESNRETWNSLASRHANNIDMYTNYTCHQVHGGIILLLTWFIPKDVAHEIQIARSDGALVFTANPIDDRFGGIVNCKLSWNEMLQTSIENTIKLGVHLTSGEIRVNVPAATVEQCFFSDRRASRVVSTDMRFLVHWAGFDLDELAVHSLLQFGVVPPNRSISRSVSRVPAGNTLTWLPADAEPKLRPVYRFKEEHDETNAEQRVAGVLDGIVESTPSDPVLLFSGGVDSGILAARFASLGRRDVRLINFAFSADDPQGEYASQVAGSLGFGCDRVLFRMCRIPEMIERIGREYSFPFVDSSSLPTNLLVEKAAEISGQPTVVIEGTGADGEFGMAPGLIGWSRLHQIPRPIRQAIGGAYDMLALWRNAPTARLEFLVRALRQSARYSLGVGVFCQNGLDGIAYSRRAECLENEVFQPIKELTTDLSPESALSFTDMIQVCAGRFAAKSFDPLRSRGLMPCYPFLQPSMLQLSLSLPWHVKCRNGERKSLLKNILVKAVPRDLVYRKKSGFNAPMAAIMATDVMQDYLRDVALASDSPLIKLLKVKKVTEMVDRVRGGQGVAQGVHNLLWCLVFLSAWLDQCGFARLEAGA